MVFKTNRPNFDAP